MPVALCWYNNNNNDDDDDDNMSGWFDWQLKKMSSDEMLSLFQEILEDVVGQLFKPDKVRDIDSFQMMS